MQTRFVLAAALAALPSALSAQTPVELIGFSRLQNVIQQDMGTCLTRVCGPVLPVNPNAPPFAGGTTWDATSGGAWITNGQVIMQVDARCQVMCPPSPLVLPINAVATGLAVNEAAGQMFMTDSAGGIHTLTLRCPPNQVVRCPVLLPANHTLGGIASSDVQDLLFYTSSDFTPGNPPNNTLHVAPRANPCVAFCRLAVPTCGGVRLGPITGVAFDDCRSVVWCTDGTLVVGLQFGAAVCAVNEVQCCRLPIAADSYIGLCVRPSQSTAVGQNCTAPACPNCPNMSHTTIGDPALGNPTFGLVLNNAPANSRAFLLINAGPCGPGLVLPGWCGAFHVPLPGVIVLGPFATGGVGPCDGGAVVPLGIPLAPNLCGALLSTQWAALCFTPIGNGTAVSNCLTHQISAT